MDLCAVKYLLLLSVNIHLTSAATHSLQYIYTAVTPGINFAEFTLVSLVDGEQIMYYDSYIRKMIPKTEWMKKVTDDEPGYWIRETRYAQEHEESFKVNLDTVMQRFNQTAGVHSVQRMYGCELDDDDDDDKTFRGYSQYGYDGEDYISLDLNTCTWTAAKPQGVITKREWDCVGEAARRKDYLENECIDWLEKFVNYGRSTLKRKVPPEVSLFQKDSSSPVVCHATGFYPKTLNITWQKNGEDLYEDMEIREPLPNLDGTFQKRSILNVSFDKLDSDKYTCIIQHPGLEREIQVLQVSDRRVLTGGGSGGGSVGVIIGVTVAVLLVIVGAVIWKKKSDFTPVPANPTADSDTS